MLDLVKREAEGWRPKLLERKGHENQKGGGDLLSEVEKYCILFNPLRFSGLGKFCTSAASQEFSGKPDTRLSLSQGTETL